MSFTLPDLLIENSIRNGFAAFRAAATASDAADANSTINQLIDVVFDFTNRGTADGGIGQLSRKYSAEKERLRLFFASTEVAIVQSFSDVQTHLPCVSIQLQADGEDQGLALTDDFGGLEVSTMTNAVGRDENTIHANTTINVGIHSKEQLLTKYLYHLTKYFVLSNKVELIRQNFIIATFRGSDFQRDASWQGDHVYTRFLNISGKTEDSWVDINEITVALADVDLGLLVPGDVASGTPVSMNTPASEAIMTIAAGSSTIEVENSFYLPAMGDARLVTRNGFGQIIGTSLLINITANDTATNTITTDTTIPVAFQVVVSTDLNLRRTTELIAGDTVLIVATIQTPPSPIQTGGGTQVTNDTGSGSTGTLHRSNIDGQQT